MADDVSASGSGTEGDSFWDQAAFAIKGDKGIATQGGWAMGAVTSGPIAGGFMMDPETAEGMVRKAKWAADRVRQAVEDSERLRNAQPPAEDTASRHFQDVAVEMFRIGADHQYVLWKRYRDIADKLQKALDVYNETDEQAGKDVKKSGGDDGGGLFN
ncbi:MULTISPECIES: hypothetical protein [Prauserella salsuginis group]|uniref:Excreted virulence factor EspC (Type VII ESX diderm) n=1 Tax=Prauserella salsuginis TaxID=387889 RepID=A0ABW6GAV2_9PSEU|nr:MULTISPECIES: hypothetical protein [Prauserella salsuginis group]MCR3722408.1 hypothetical protein [Prauserella flava]MCR3736850.1 hypothetical protein [Prauserella salsuginis]